MQPTLTLTSTTLPCTQRRSANLGRTTVSFANWSRIKLFRQTVAHPLTIYLTTSAKRGTCETATASASHNTAPLQSSTPISSLPQYPTPFPEELYRSTAHPRRASRHPPPPQPLPSSPVPIPLSTPSLAAPATYPSLPTRIPQAPSGYPAIALDATATNPISSSQPR